MDNVTFIEKTDSVTNEVTEYAIIDRGNGEFTSMPKAVYEAQQVEHLTEIPPQAALSTPIVSSDGE